jgi:DNA-binding transcriptional LysR family regulator
MPDFRLHVFRIVAELGSITSASRHLHLSQPAVTKHIKLLEEGLRLRLLLRSSSGVTLTPAGLILLKFVTETEASYGEVLAKMSVGLTDLSGRLRVASSTTVLQYFLPDVLSVLRRRHPAIEIEVIEGNTDFVISAMLSSRAELGLIEAPCRRRDLRVSPFYDDEIVVISSARETPKEMTLSALKRAPLIFREIGSGTQASVEQALQKKGVRLSDLRIVQQLPSTEAIKRMVASGLGLGFVSSLSIQNELSLGQLQRVKIPGLRIDRAFSVIQPLGPDPVGLRHAFLTVLKGDARG